MQYPLNQILQTTQELAVVISPVEPCVSASVFVRESSHAGLTINSV